MFPPEETTEVLFQMQTEGLFFPEPIGGTWNQAQLAST